MRCPPKNLTPLAVAVAVCACTPDALQPKLYGVTPEWGYRGADTEIVVDGRRFFPLVEARGAREIAVEDGFSVTLATSPPTSLGGVYRRDDTQLAATVPAGLGPGRYDLTVIGPDGASDRLEGAFTVTDTEAAFISLSAPQIRADVREDALIELQLRDPSGGDVPSAIEVEIAAVPLSGDVSAIVFRDGLVDQESLAPGVIRGFLDSGGGADLYFTSAVVDDVALEVRGLGLNEHLYSMGPQVRFEPASIADVRLSIANPDNITVGEPFSVTAQLLDADGNPTRGELLVATAQETCGYGSHDYTSVWTIPDALVVNDVVLAGATVPGACDENRLRLVGVLNGEAFVVESDPIDVKAGEVVGYQVLPTRREVVAGTDLQTLLVRAEDAWGNPVPAHTATLNLTDDLGGLGPDFGVGTASCSDFFDGQAVCGVTLERAGPAVVVTAVDGEGLSGVSSEFRVLANSATSVEVDVDAEELVAGEQVLILTQLRDGYGNAAALDPLGGMSAVVLSDSTASLSCAGRFKGPDDGLLYSLCSLTVADPASVVTASVPSGGFSADADPVRVANAEVALVDIDVDVTELMAGESLSFELAGFDAFGNPYVEQSTSTVLLSDLGLELTPIAVALDGDGQGAGAVTLVRATDSNALTVSVFGVQLGVSTPLSVTPGPHAGYTVELGSTWVEVVDSHSAQVFAIDSWGNVATSVDSVIDLASALDAGDPLERVDLLGGTVSVEFVWDAVVLQDQLMVTDGTFTGSSDAVDVVSFDCVDGPTADLTVSDADELRLCLVGGTTSVTDLSAEDSVEGGGALVSWHAADGDGATSRLTTDAWTESWRAAGGRVPHVVVVDDVGCADLAEVTVWVGVSDGEPVGAVEIELDDNTLSAGSSSAGTTRVDLAAWDCAGDPSRRGTLQLRTELGDLVSSGSTLTSTGTGLTIVLDANGEGSVDWSVTSADNGGEPAIHAGVPSGAAHGKAVAMVSGDARRPYIVELSPVGSTLDSWSTVVLRASEPLYASSVTTSSVEITDPDGDAVLLSDVNLSEDDQLVTITPATPVDGSLGTWTLSMEASVRDDGGGNRIDGSWTGFAGSLLVDFGDVVNAAPDITSCVADLTHFRPDGDSGAGVEADKMEIAVSAAAIPSMWWLEVTDDDGGAVHWAPTTATGSTVSLDWDGRDVHGHIVQAGTYSLQVTARDSNFSEGAACSVIVGVDHPISAPESQ